MMTTLKLPLFSLVLLVTASAVTGQSSVQDPLPDSGSTVSEQGVERKTWTTPGKWIQNADGTTSSELIDNRIFGGGVPQVVPFPAPVPAPFSQPFPVPHPVPQHVPYPYPVPHPVPHPYPVPHPVPQHVPYPYPVPHPYPVPYPKPYPVPYPVPQHVPYPYPVPHPYPVPVPYPKPYPVPYPQPVYVKKYPVPYPQPVFVKKYPAPYPQPVFVKKIPVPYYPPIKSHDHTAHHHHTVPKRCQLPVVVGSCGGAFPSWYFNGLTCQAFSYSGCEGNANRFSSVKACQDVCGALHYHENKGAHGAGHHHQRL